MHGSSVPSSRNCAAFCRLNFLSNCCRELDESNRVQENRPPHQWAVTVHLQVCNDMQNCKLEALEYLLKNSTPKKTLDDSA